jgi:hypothetical protein
MGFSMTGPLGNGKAPVIAGKGPTKAPATGGAPIAPPKPSIVKPPKSPAGKVAASKAAGNGLLPLEQSNPAQIGKLASASAAKIYRPIMAGYNQQLRAANGLAQKRSADVAAFGQWYGQQQSALATQEQTRQDSLNTLLGQLNTPSTTPQNGITSSDGTNMAQPSGGAAALGAAGDNASQSGVLSSSALSANEAGNSSNNELTALGGAYQQNMMATISGDLTKSQSSIEDAQSKAITNEGTAQSKIDTNMTSYLNDANKNIVATNKNTITGETAAQKAADVLSAATQKNDITSSYDTSQTNNKQLSELVALAKSLKTVPPALATRIAQLSGGADVSGATTGVGVTAANDATKNGLAQYEDVTKRLAINATVTNNKDKNAIAAIKNNIDAASTGAKVAVSNAEVKYYAAKTGESTATAKADLIKAYAYAAHYGTGGKGAVQPLTTDEATTQLSKAGGYQTFINTLEANSKAGKATKGVTGMPKNQQDMRKWITTNYGAGGSMTASLMWSAFDMHYYGGLTPRTKQMLLNEGIPSTSLKNYSTVQPKTKTP